MTDGSVRKSVTVQAPVEKAFTVFTQGMDNWWPRSHKTGEGDLRQAVLEGREGGRWYEIDTDGSECEWGRVLTWKPPTLLVLAWQIDAAWRFDPQLVTEVEIRFISEGPDRTRVELEHRDLDRFGEAQDQARAAFESPGGWPRLLDAFAQEAAA
ncbi:MULTISPECIES: SRPBCC family protein [unclassified Streptomyces]|uniref:SRPBCC family protein n=1 Tax=unclassified Streptomyces TaxID=2593676 RepID=UPI00224E8D56|nr:MULTISPECIES: SRPBCC family protein [unclassified Streptomyces]MCX5287087.1 SRPBCC family protein [Streptomyces sp. NBC_00183]